MRTKKNEYEITCFRMGEFFDICNDVNNMFINIGGGDEIIPKNQNFLYMISGNNYYKKKLIFKLDDGELFVSSSKKERISDINDDVQYYHEQIGEDDKNKWYRIKETNCKELLSEFKDSYLYFSFKTKYKIPNNNFSIREDKTLFINANTLEIENRVQYIEFESDNKGVINENSCFFYKIFIEKLGFQPISIEMSKLSICKSKRNNNVPQNIDNISDYIYSIFDLVYSEMISA